MLAERVQGIEMLVLGQHWLGSRRLHQTASRGERLSILLVRRATEATILSPGFGRGIWSKAVMRRNEGSSHGDRQANPFSPVPFAIAAMPELPQTSKGSSTRRVAPRMAVARPPCSRLPGRDSCMENCHVLQHRAASPLLMFREDEGDRLTSLVQCGE